MAITLYPHNASAYEAAVAMLAETGKAAIVHPTGTGKSFIAFKLCEDHPDKTICWLSPSEYIFSTQLENLKKAAGGCTPENIRFFTYARLMLMDGPALSEIHPDYIVLDEFHRCGADQWGAGVRRLLDIFPHTPLLGLTATSIRYLDSRRDMADELFDSNIASQITLGEAVATGILPVPKYVLSSFSFNQDIRAYAARVNRIRNTAVRLKAENCLEALRRAIERADGLDTIFKKHITDTSGKYILFVPSYEAMQDVKERCREWLREIDPAPHIYTAYTDDPATSEAFAAFKSDASAHMKVLLAINMLNEGIHVADIAGVILFRPTVSPIIYKQQIGRALSASKTKTPLILDVVANICNLCTVDALRIEIADAAQRVRESGEGKGILAEDFTVIDEVADCRRLFAALDDILTSSWEEMYRRLEAFKAQYGHVNVHARYKTPDGLSLGNWCACQRRVYKGRSKGILTAERIRRLNAIGFQWDPDEDRWMERYHLAEEYFHAHGNLLIKQDYETKGGIRLGAWVQQNRTACKNRRLPADRVRMLDRIGMVWDVADYQWDRSYALCKAYFEEHDCPPPTTYVAEDGSTPGRWLSRVIVRQADNNPHYKPLRKDQIERLERIGVTFGRHSDRAWNQAFAEAEAYYREHRHLEVPSTYVTESGLHLAAWLDYQRQSNAGLNHSPMPPARRDKLDSLGFDWGIKERREDAWMACYESLNRYVKAHGGKCPPQKYVDENGLGIGTWLTNQRRKYRSGSLDKNQEDLLRSVGVDFSDINEKLWACGYREAELYYNKYMNLAVPVAYKTENGFSLGEWVRTQLKVEQTGKIKEERKALLDRLGVQWKETAISVL